MELALFSMLAAVTVTSSLAVILLRQPVHSALSFLLTLASLAGLFWLLWAPFIAVIQIIIYAGAIMVLFLFVIMLLHAQRGEGPIERLRWQRPLAMALAILFFAGLAWLASIPSPKPVSFALLPAQSYALSELGRLLFTDFLLPFEIASVILLAAIVGAVVLGKRTEEGES